MHLLDHCLLEERGKSERVRLCRVRWVGVERGNRGRSGRKTCTILQASKEPIFRQQSRCTVRAFHFSVYIVVVDFG